MLEDGRYKCFISYYLKTKMNIVNDGFYACLLITMIILASLLPEGLSLGFNALEVTKDRVGEIKNKIPAIHHD
jgi:hypothetical protein